MPELIDKKRTEAKVFLIARFFIDRPDREVELVKAVIHRCCEEIDKQPTIEAEPVRHGRWENIDQSFAHVYCSECGAASDKHLVKRYKGCPFCLCIMDATDTNVGGKEGADNDSE